MYVLPSFHKLVINSVHFNTLSYICLPVFIVYQCPEKDIATFSGLVQSHLAIGKLNDAIVYAKEAIKEMPGSASAYCIFGKVLMQVPDKTAEAIKAFSKALKLRYLPHFLSCH